MSKINADRFMGFADTYEAARPALPPFAVESVLRYLDTRPQLVVDLGCGTGLSTLAWQGEAARVVGVDPSRDMLAVAMQKEKAGFEFIQAFSDAVPLKDHDADVVICSQSFHWMEPVATLREIARLLRPGGVFAAVDCDWPPVIGWRVESAYGRLMSKVKQIEAGAPALSDGFKQYSKENHLKHMQQSGFFSYLREIVFANRETATRERILALAFSQGGLQAVLRHSPNALAQEIDALTDCLNAMNAAETFPIDFCYRMRIGICPAK